MSGNPPADVVRDGSLKASIWENEGKKGPYYTTTLAKTYEDRNGQLRDTNVFNNSDLLRVSELARQAYARTNDLRQDMLNEQKQDQSREARAQAFLQEQDQSQNHAPQHDRGVDPEI